MVKVARMCVCGKETDLLAHEGYYCSSSCALFDAHLKIIDNTYFSHYERVYKHERRRLSSTSYRHIGNVVKATQTLKGHGYMSIGEWELGDHPAGDDAALPIETVQSRADATSPFKLRRSSSVSSMRPRLQDRPHSLGQDIEAQHFHLFNESTLSLPEYATWPMSYSSSIAQPRNGSISFIKTPSDIQIPLRRHPRRRNALFMDTFQPSPLDADAINSSRRTSPDSFLAIPDTNRSAVIEDLPESTSVPSVPSEPIQSQSDPPRRRQRGRMVDNRPPGLEVLMKKSPHLPID